MKNTFYKIQFIALLFLAANQTAYAQWQKVLDQDSFARSRPASFVIGDTAYLANGDPAGFVYAQDLHGYTQNSNTWTTLRPYPGGGGDWGIRFQIGDTAYIGGGANPSWQSDFWKYTPSQGWTNLGNTPSSLNMGFNMSFSIGNKGYVCGGFVYGTAIDSFWEYDPITNKFTSKAPFPGGPRGSGITLSALGYGYVGLGGDGSGKTYKDMYRYDPATDHWDTMATLPADTGFFDSGFFTLCGKLVVTMGDSVQSGTSTTRQTWLFDPYNGAKGKWTRLPDYPGLLPSYAPAGWAMGDTGFIYGGWNQPSWMDRSEMYRFLPSRTLMNMLASPLDTSICSGNSVTLKGSSSLNYSWNTSDTTADITVSPTQTTTYIVTETSGACLYLDTLVVNVSSGFALQVTPDPAAICNGQSIVLTASGGISYQWVGTSNTTDTITVHPTKDTTYELLASSSTCSRDTFISVAVVNNAPPLTFTPKSPSVCNGQPIILIADTTGKNYTWSPGTGLNTTSGDSVVANPTATITYTVTGLDSLGCMVTASDTVKVNIAPVLIAYPPSPAVECNGQPIIITVPASGSDYTWSPATGLSATTGSSVVANPTADITYTITGIDSLGCMVTGMEAISIQYGPNKPTITVSVTGDTLFSSAKNGDQWYLNGTPVNGATDSLYVITGFPANDSITVSVINVGNGCSTTSDPFITGINQLSVINNQLSIYPNPTNGMINVNISSSAVEIKDWNLQVIDVLGRMLYTRQSLSYTNEIDLSNLPGGDIFYNSNN